MYLKHTLESLAFCSSSSAIRFCTPFNSRACSKDSCSFCFTQKSSPHFNTWHICSGSKPNVFAPAFAISLASGRRVTAPIPSFGNTVSQRGHESSFLNAVELHLLPVTQNGRTKKARSSCEFLQQMTERAFQMRKHTNSQNTCLQDLVYTAVLSDITSQHFKQCISPARDDVQCERRKGWQK